MPKKPPRYALAVQRRAVEQVLHQSLPIAHVARQLRCSPQSIKNWIAKHHKSLSPSTAAPSPSLPSSKSSFAFLPIQVGHHSPAPLAKIELVTKNGLTLRFPIEMVSDTLCAILRR